MITKNIEGYILFPIFCLHMTVFFSLSTAKEAHIMRNILTTYQEASGQAINLGKLSISLMVMSILTQKILQVTDPLDNGICLGLPLLIGRRKNVIFSYLKERIWSCIQSSHNKPLSKAGREYH